MFGLPAGRNINAVFPTALRPYGRTLMPRGINAPFGSPDVKYENLHCTTTSYNFTFETRINRINKYIFATTTINKKMLYMQINHKYKYTSL